MQWTCATRSLSGPVLLECMSLSQWVGGASGRVTWARAAERPVPIVVLLVMCWLNRNAAHWPPDHFCREYSRTKGPIGKLVFKQIVGWEK